MPECAHGNFTRIGSTTWTGPTYQQIADVLYCPECHMYAYRTSVFLDFKRDRPEDTARYQAEESAKLKALIAAHKETLSNPTP